MCRLTRLLLCSVAGVLASPVARADLLELSDGRIVEGAVEETPEGYRLRTRFGETLLSHAEVRSRSQGRSVDALVRERLAALAADDAINRAQLARWLVEVGRGEEGQALAEAALEIDAECAIAHAVLGHERHGGRWMSPEQAQRAKGLEWHAGRWYTPEEWMNVATAARDAAVRADAHLRAQELAGEVSRLARLMASPDQAARARARRRLEAIATETGNADIRRVIDNVAQYVAAAEEVARASSDGTSARVLTELRITMSKLKRPIDVFTTSLASNGGAPVKLQLPELEVVSLRTMVGLPALVGR